MASPTNKNHTIHVIPGSFSNPSFYDSLLTSLHTLGYPALTTPILSASNPSSLPPATMQDDAASIRSVTAALVEEGKDVVFVMHSYGGIPGTESVKGLLKKDREMKGLKGGVVRLVYMSAMVVAVGSALFDVFAGQFPDFLKFDGDYMSQDPIEVAKLAFSDLPPERALEEAKKMPQHSVISFLGKLSYAAYNECPVSYITMSEDKIIPLEFQKHMIENVIEKDGKTKVDVLELVSGHCPMISQPRKTAELIVQAIKAGAA